MLLRTVRILINIHTYPAARQLVRPDLLPRGAVQPGALLARAPDLPAAGVARADRAPREAERRDVGVPGGARAVQLLVSLVKVASRGLDVVVAVVDEKVVLAGGAALALQDDQLAAVARHLRTHHVIADHVTPVVIVTV